MTSIAISKKESESPLIAIRPIPLLWTLFIGVSIWFSPVPEGLDIKAWHMLAIFSATIVGAITSPLPLAPTVLCGMVTAICTGTASFSAMFQSFSSPTVWLVCLAFFLASGVIRCGLAKRAAYFCVGALGKSTVGLAYGLALGEALLAPLVPSVAARAGGILFPLVSALAGDYDDGRPLSKGNRTARFLILVVFQCSAISSALFLTSMAANPLMAQLAADLNISLGWGEWAWATIVPGIASLLIAPLVVYVVSRPGHLATPEAPKRAKQMLAEMGPVSTAEWRMLGVFSVVLSLWLFGPPYGINSTTAVIIGILLMIVFGLLEWEGCLGEKKAWDTLLWLGGFVAMGTELKSLGFFDWMGLQVGSSLGTLSWGVGFPVLCLIYYYSHYLFASNTAHVVGMYFVCLVTAVQIGAPPKVAALSFAVISNLFGGLTHYGNASAPLYFATGYCSLSHWWKVGFVVSVVNFIVWAVVGMAWWKCIGLW